VSKIFAHVGSVLASSLRAVSASSPLVVAYSGGIDSTLLLHAVHAYCEENNRPIAAVYVNHGLSDNADSWARHCRVSCDFLDVPFYEIKVHVERAARMSVEAQARKARYSALDEFCQTHNGVLCLGQHAQDQIETVLLQLKRGAGPQGLSGMAGLQWRNNILTLRPLLSIDKPEIVKEASERRLHWIEDESNADKSFERNFLRNDILPMLNQKWPQLFKTVARSAALCAEQTELMHDITQERLQMCTIDADKLSISALQTFDDKWQRAIIRGWFEKHGVQYPSFAQLGEITKMLVARQDAKPEVFFPWGKVARHDGAIYWLITRSEHIPSTLPLQLNTSTTLTWLGNTITAHYEGQDTLSLCLKTNIRADKVKPKGAGVSKPLKHWFKQWKIPVWERPKIGVIYNDKVPAALVFSSHVIELTTAPSGLAITIN
jgi:tRNA(Ile)-lysidine synthase